MDLKKSKKSTLVCILQQLLQASSSNEEKLAIANAFTNLDTDEIDSDDINDLLDIYLQE
jgi:uncharacterized protein YfkK (UPF0435 family)